MQSSFVAATKFAEFQNISPNVKIFKLCRKASGVIACRPACLLENGLTLPVAYIGCSHDRANIEQLAPHSMIYSMLIRRAGGL